MKWLRSEELPKQKKSKGSWTALVPEKSVVSNKHKVRTLKNENE